jgi:hypothetical protein
MVFARFNLRVEHDRLALSGICFEEEAARHKICTEKKIRANAMLQRSQQWFVV